ncbi:ubiquitin carboxyl-terminal hydrolase [Toxoplasma gondii GT1]|uniref:Ubiquitin carboxyl-terminal hydrolase n=2 Tax=Toxoplasma gondii TaxID=5811 RepID=S7UJT4_TOXGG|nr:ubiquitin carboxyl-terminal hydrolase [Toxoplasma gondii GT1]KAF4645096.1 ubiquitin carboxyl-terminal hydrolase [Toxoplasma gondii]
MHAEGHSSRQLPSTSAEPLVWSFCSAPHAQVPYAAGRPTAQAAFPYGAHAAVSSDGSFVPAQLSSADGACGALPGVSTPGYTAFACSASAQEGARNLRCDMPATRSGGDTPSLAHGGSWPVQARGLYTGEGGNFWLPVSRPDAQAAQVHGLSQAVQRSVLARDTAPFASSHAFSGQNAFAEGSSQVQATAEVRPPTSVSSSGAEVPTFAFSSDPGAVNHSGGFLPAPQNLTGSFLRQEEASRVAFAGAGDAASTCTNRSRETLGSGRAAPGSRDGGNADAVSDQNRGGEEHCPLPSLAFAGTAARDVHCASEPPSLAERLGGGKAGDAGVYVHPGETNRGATGGFKLPPHAPETPFSQAIPTKCVDARGFITHSEEVMIGVERPNASQRQRTIPDAAHQLGDHASGVHTPGAVLTADPPSWHGGAPVPAPFVHPSVVQPLTENGFHVPAGEWSRSRPQAHRRDSGLHACTDFASPPCPHPLAEVPRHATDVCRPLSWSERRTDALLARTEECPPELSPAPKKRRRIKKDKVPSTSATQTGSFSSASDSRTHEPAPTGAKVKRIRPATAAAGSNTRQLQMHPPEVLSFSPSEDTPEKRTKEKPRSPEVGHERIGDAALGVPAPPEGRNSVNAPDGVGASSSQERSEFITERQEEAAATQSSAATASVSIQRSQAVAPEPPLGPPAPADSSQLPSASSVSLPTAAALTRSLCVSPALPSAPSSSPSSSDPSDPSPSSKADGPQALRDASPGESREAVPPSASLNEPHDPRELHAQASSISASLETVVPRSRVRARPRSLFGNCRRPGRRPRRPERGGEPERGASLVKTVEGSGAPGVPCSRSPSVHARSSPACVVVGYGAVMPTREVAGNSLMGLINLGGGSCFLNAVLQCLANCQPLRDFYLQWAETLPPRELLGRQYAVYTKHLERLAPFSRRRVKRRPQEERGAVCTSISWELATVINHMWRQSGSVKFLKPDALYQACCRIMPDFDPHEMQDSDEFLRLLLDILDAELRAAVLQLPLEDVLLLQRRPTKWQSDDGSPQVPGSEAASSRTGSVSTLETPPMSDVVSSGSGSPSSPSASHAASPVSSPLPRSSTALHTEASALPPPVKGVRRSADAARERASAASATACASSEAACASLPRALQEAYRARVKQEATVDSEGVSGSRESRPLTKAEAGTLPNPEEKSAHKREESTTSGEKAAPRVTSSTVDAVQTLFSLVFEGGEVDEVRCSACGRRTATLVPFKSLAVAMTQEAQQQACYYSSMRAKPATFSSELVPVDLVECLDRHFADDADSLKLSTGEGYFCCRCQRKQDAVKRCCLVKDHLPFVLCLTLKRFVRGHDTYKIWNPVRFGEFLDLSKYVRSDAFPAPTGTEKQPGGAADPAGAGGDIRSGRVSWSASGDSADAKMERGGEAASALAPVGTPGGKQGQECGGGPTAIQAKVEQKSQCEFPRLSGGLSLCSEPGEWSASRYAASTAAWRGPDAPGAVAASLPRGALSLSACSSSAGGRTSTGDSSQADSPPAFRDRQAPTLACMEAGRPAGGAEAKASMAGSPASGLEGIRSRDGRDTWTHMSESSEAESAMKREKNEGEASGDSRSACKSDTRDPESSLYRYCLVALIEHEGPATDQGHYVCYVKHLETGQWFKADDKLITLVDLSQVLAAAPYMLFYERVRTSESMRSYPFFVSDEASVRSEKHEQGDTHAEGDTEGASSSTFGPENRKARAWRRCDWSSWTQRVKEISVPSDLFADDDSGGPSSSCTRQPSPERSPGDSDTRGLSPASAMSGSSGRRARSEAPGGVPPSLFSSSCASQALAAAGKAPRAAGGRAGLREAVGASSGAVRSRVGVSSSRGASCTSASGAAAPEGHGSFSPEAACRARDLSGESEGGSTVAEVAAAQREPTFAPTPTSPQGSTEPASRGRPETQRPSEKAFPRRVGLLEPEHVSTLPPASEAAPFGSAGSIRVLSGGETEAKVRSLSQMERTERKRGAVEAPPRRRASVEGGGMGLTAADREVRRQVEASLLTEAVNYQIEKGRESSRGKAPSPTCESAAGAGTDGKVAEVKSFLPREKSVFLGEGSEEEAKRSGSFQKNEKDTDTACITSVKGVAAVDPCGGVCPVSKPDVSQKAFSETSEPPDRQSGLGSTASKAFAATPQRPSEVSLPAPDSGAGVAVSPPLWTGAQPSSCAVSGFAVSASKPENAVPISTPGWHVLHASTSFPQGPPAFQGDSYLREGFAPAARLPGGSSVSSSGGNPVDSPHVTHGGPPLGDSWKVQPGAHPPHVVWGSQGIPESRLHAYPRADGSQQGFAVQVAADLQSAQTPGFSTQWLQETTRSAEETVRTGTGAPPTAGTPLAVKGGGPQVSLDSREGQGRRREGSGPPAETGAPVWPVGERPVDGGTAGATWKQATEIEGLSAKPQVASARPEENIGPGGVDIAPASSVASHADPVAPSSGVDSASAPEDAQAAAKAAAAEKAAKRRRRARQLQQQNRRLKNAEAAEVEAAAAHAALPSVGGGREPVAHAAEMGLAASEAARGGISTTAPGSGIFPQQQTQAGQAYVGVVPYPGAAGREVPHGHPGVAFSEGFAVTPACAPLPQGLPGQGYRAGGQQLGTATLYTWSGAPGKLYGQGTSHVSSPSLPQLQSHAVQWNASFSVAAAALQEAAAAAATDAGAQGEAAKPVAAPTPPRRRKKNGSAPETAGAARVEGLSVSIQGGVSQPVGGWNPSQHLPQGPLLSGTALGPNPTVSRSEVDHGRGAVGNFQAPSQPGMSDYLGVHMQVLGASGASGAGDCRAVFASQVPCAGTSSGPRSGEPQFPGACGGAATSASFYGSDGAFSSSAPVMGHLPSVAGPQGFLPSATAEQARAPVPCGESVQPPKKPPRKRPPANKAVQPQAQTEIALSASQPSACAGTLGEKHSEFSTPHGHLRQDGFESSSNSVGTSWALQTTPDSAAGRPREMQRQGVSKPHGLASAPPSLPQTCAVPMGYKSGPFPQPSLHALPAAVTGGTQGFTGGVCTHCGRPATATEQGFQPSCSCATRFFSASREGFAAQSGVTTAGATWPSHVFPGERNPSGDLLPQARPAHAAIGEERVLPQPAFVGTVDSNQQLQLNYPSTQYGWPASAGRGTNPSASGFVASHFPAQPSPRGAERQGPGAPAAAVPAHQLGVAWGTQARAPAVQCMQSSSSGRAGGVSAEAKKRSRKKKPSAQDASVMKSSQQPGEVASDAGVAATVEAARLNPASQAHDIAFQECSPAAPRAKSRATKSVDKPEPSVSSERLTGTPEAIARVFTDEHSLQGMPATQLVQASGSHAPCPRQTHQYYPGDLMSKGHGDRRDHTSATDQSWAGGTFRGFQNHVEPVSPVKATSAQESFVRGQQTEGQSYAWGWTGASVGGTSCHQTNFHGAAQPAMVQAFGSTAVSQVLPSTVPGSRDGRGHFENNGLQTRPAMGVPLPNSESVYHHGGVAVTHLPASGEALLQQQQQHAVYAGSTVPKTQNVFQEDARQYSTGMSISGPAFSHGLRAVQSMPTVNYNKVPEAGRLGAPAPANHPEGAAAGMICVSAPSHVGMDAQHFPPGVVSAGGFYQAGYKSSQRFFVDGAGEPMRTRPP